VEYEDSTFATIRAGSTNCSKVARNGNRTTEGLAFSYGLRVETLRLVPVAVSIALKYPDASGGVVCERCTDHQQITVGGESAAETVIIAVIVGTNESSYLNVFAVFILTVYVDSGVRGILTRHTDDNVVSCLGNCAAELLGLRGGTGSDQENSDQEGPNSLLHGLACDEAKNRWEFLRTGGEKSLASVTDGHLNCYRLSPSFGL